MNDKKCAYEEPSVEFVLIDQDDVIVASGVPGEGENELPIVPIG